MFLNSVRYKLSLLMTLILTLPNPCLRERQKTLRKKYKVFNASEFLLSLSPDCKTWPHDLKIKYSHLIGFGFVISPVAFLKNDLKKQKYKLTKRLHYRGKVLQNSHFYSIRSKLPETGRPPPPGGP